MNPFLAVPALSEAWVRLAHDCKDKSEYVYDVVAAGRLEMRAARACDAHDQLLGARGFAVICLRLRVPRDGRGLWHRQ